MYAISCVSQLCSTTYLPIDALEFVDKTVSMIDAQLLRWVAIMLATIIARLKTPTRDLMAIITTIVASNGFCLTERKLYYHYILKY